MICWLFALTRKDIVSLSSFSSTSNTTIFLAQATETNFFKLINCAKALSSVKSLQLTLSLASNDNLPKTLFCHSIVMRSDRLDRETGIERESCCPNTRSTTFPNKELQKCRSSRFSVPSQNRFWIIINYLTFCIFSFTFNFRHKKFRWFSRPHRRNFTQRYCRVLESFGEFSKGESILQIQFGLQMNNTPTEGDILLVNDLKK